jgi:hypothetical protein
MVCNGGGTVVNVDPKTQTVGNGEPQSVTGRDKIITSSVSTTQHLAYNQIIKSKDLKSNYKINFQT